MLVQEVEKIRMETGGTCREVLDAAGLSRATFHRWTTRLQHQDPFVQTPGPKKEAPLDLEALLAEVQQMKHCRRRSLGTTALYEAHRQEISRRQLQGLVKDERRRVNAQRRASLRRITWHVPGMAWAMDGTEIGPVQLHQVQDLASRYKYDPFLAATLRYSSLIRGSVLDAVLAACTSTHRTLPLESFFIRPMTNEFPD